MRNVRSTISIPAIGSPTTVSERSIVKGTAATNRTTKPVAKLLINSSPLSVDFFTTSNVLTEIGRASCRERV